MKIVEEEVRRTRSVYRVRDDITGEETIHGIRVLYEGNDYGKPIVYSSKMEPIMEGTLFLREEIGDESLNTRLQAASALKCLYAYLEIFAIGIDSMTRQQAKGYVEFLRGTLGDGLSFKVSLRSLRSESTVARYLSTARRLVSYLEITDSPLLERKQPSRAKWGQDSKWQVQPYSISVKLVGELDAPKCVSQDQYLAILSHLEGPERKRDRVIVRLMYDHGLRLGEVLGLTLEDIRPYLDSSGMPRYMLEIRNRVSDKPHQKAKGAMKVKSRKSYRSSTYRTAGIGAGYECVVIGVDLAESLIECIEEMHGDDCSEGYANRRREHASADRVLDRLAEGVENRYLFLNTLGRPLTGQRWGQILRPVFEAADVPIDKEVRRNNLSHRLRHGFARHLKYDLHLDDFAVMVLMRHTSLLSAKPYDNPTPEDILQMQEDIIDGDRH